MRRSRRHGVLRQFHRPLYILFVLVALVLLIACANVANMLLLNLWPTAFGAHPERVLLFTMKPQREI